jgi:riboflavin synthase
MDGHVVQGHVDGLGRVQHIQQGREGQVWTFSVDGTIMPFIIPKGSVAIDGVSLTIAHVDNGTFKVALIPTTIERTTLASTRIGDRVNIETDILARTIVTTLQRWQSSGSQPPLTVEMLRENGW